MRIKRNHFTPTPALAATLGAAALALALASCEDADQPLAPSTEAAFTAGSGTQSTLIGRGTHMGDFKVKRITGDWHGEVKVKSGLDVAVQSITFQPGGQSGWHSHPGPVFIQVVSGTMTFYESNDPDCSPVVRTAGQGFLDVGDHAHIARNETDSPAQNVVVYLAPPGAVLRIDEPDPGHCPF